MGPPGYLSLPLPTWGPARLRSAGQQPWPWLPWALGSCAPEAGPGTEAARADKAEVGPAVRQCGTPPPPPPHLGPQAKVALRPPPGSRGHGLQPAPSPLHG
jgi:hypothetical protein